MRIGKGKREKGEEGEEGGGKKKGGGKEQGRLAKVYIKRKKDGMDRTGP